MNKIKTFFVICENFWKHQYRCKVPLDSAPINHDKWFYLAVSVPICLSVLHPFCLLPLPLQPGSRREWPPVHQLSGKTSLYGVGLLSSLRPMSWARKLTRFPRSRAPGFLSHSCIVYLSPTCLVFLTTCSLFSLMQPVNLQMHMSVNALRFLVFYKLTMAPRWRKKHVLSKRVVRRSLQKAHALPFSPAETQRSKGQMKPRVKQGGNWRGPQRTQQTLLWWCFNGTFGLLVALFSAVLGNLRNTALGISLSEFWRKKMRLWGAFKRWALEGLAASFKKRKAFMHINAGLSGAFPPPPKKDQLSSGFLSCARQTAVSECLPLGALS